jgi:hypothetical protein
MGRLEKKVHWWPTLDPAGPRWGVWFEGDHWQLAVAEMPGQPPRYSLFLNGRKEEEFVDWPAGWTIAPDDSPGLAAQKAEYEYEIEKMEKNKDVLPIDEGDPSKNDG